MLKKYRKSRKMVVKVYLRKKMLIENINNMMIEKEKC